MNLRPRLSVDALLQDLRYAVRTMRRAPGFAAIAVGSSALGIGACTVIFSILNFALFKTLPVVDPARLMRLSEFDRRTREAGNELSYLDALDVRQARSFEGIAAYDPLLPASIGGHGEPERHWGAIATANYFAVVRPAFALGRGFDPRRDDTRGAPPVVVLSHQLWRRQFDADPGIVGRSISINKTVTTVIGVTAPAFRGTDVGIVPEFWIPFSMIDEVESRRGPVTENRTRFWLACVGRLRPDADPPVARAELDVIARTLNSVHGRGDDRGFALERAGQIDPRLRSITLVLFWVASAVTGLVLLTACSNVANLLMGRASVRRREIAARMALGASRGRLVRQLLTESLLLAVLGGLAGWFVAGYVSSLLGLMRTPLGWPLDLSISPDWRVLLFCLGLSVVTGVAFGVVPAIRGTRSDLVTDLKADGQGPAHRDRLGLQNGLVMVQVAVCTLLLLCTGLFLRSLQSAQTTSIGLRTRNLLLLSFDPGLDRRADSESRQLFRDLLERTRALPGVESATLTSAVPLTFIISNSKFVPEASANRAGTERIGADIYAVGPQFFETMGISLLAGDDFRSARAGTTRPAIVNEAFARAMFPGQSPVGQRVLGDGKALDVVGVVATAKSRSIGEAPRPSIYVPILNEYSAKEMPQGVTLIVKTSDRGTTAAAPVREIIHGLDPALAVFDVQTMESHVRDALIVPRVLWSLSAVAGTIGLAVAIVGIYGVISFAVISRRRELGIRLAIGARPGEILAMVVRGGAGLALVGTALGLLASLIVSRFAASLLYGVSPNDPLTFTAVPTVVMTVATLACVLPARAAARLDPVEVLKTE